MDNYPLDGSTGGGRPPRKELQGPRPTPLKVRKESHKIRKPPVAPPGMPPQQTPPPQQPRQPVIIYTVSPKIIHAKPNEFMTLVQRLTGPDATSASGATSDSSSSFSSSVAMAHHYVSGPAAGFEMTKMPPGILSPGPSALPPISPNLFSPFFNDPNYGINHNFNNNILNNNINNSNNNYNNNNNNNNNNPFSSSNFISPGAVISPASLDLLHQILNS